MFLTSREAANSTTPAISDALSSVTAVANDTLQPRKEMLAALAKKISAKAEIAEDRLINNSDKLVDIATTYIGSKMEDLAEGGLPLIMGIEGATLVTTGIIDIIPII